MSHYDLHAAVANVLDTTDLVDPVDISGKVAENIPPKELRRVLAMLLPSYVREVNRQQRNAHASMAERPSAGGSARSLKVAGFRSIGRDWLRSRIHVGDGWKMIADCGYDDLMVAAEQRRRLAEQNTVRADEYEALANRLRRHKVTRVADLPDAELDSVEIAA